MKEEFSSCWYKQVCNQECSSSCIRFLEMQFLVENSGLPNRYKYPISLEPQDVDYSSFCKLADIKDNIKDFVKVGNNLYLAGETTGTGKTTWSSKLLLKYFDEIWAGNGFQIRGLFVSVPAFIVQMKNFNLPVSEQYKETLLKTDLVIWDDIASTDMSAYDLSQLLIYIDGRLLAGKSNIYTGNVVKKEKFEKVVGSRLSSRIWNSSEVIIFRGSDRRTA